MAGKIENTINTSLKATGGSKTKAEFDKAAKGADNLTKSSKKTTVASDKAVKSASTHTREQQRLSNASTNTSRKFASQAQGLGGLVAAYAGAAATAYALEAAFGALANAARFEQTITGLNTLASAVGESGSAVLANIREITKEQLTLSEAASQANLALSAGFNSSQISSLAEVSLKASRALGRDLTDSMNRVVRGSAKMEAELLDELGIYTKIGPSTEAYAASIGKAVTELTEYERRQAFVNAVIAEGNSKYGDINTSIPTAAQKLEAFGTKVLDLGTKLGSFLAEKVAPIAEFLTNSFAGSASIAALALSLLAKRGITELTNGLDKFSDAAEQKAQRIEDRIASISKSAKTDLESSATALSTIDTQKGLSRKTGEQQALQAIKASAKAGTLSRKQLAQATDLLAAKEQGLIAKEKEENNEITKLSNKIKELEKRKSNLIKTTDRADKSTDKYVTSIVELNSEISKSTNLLEANKRSLQNSKTQLEQVAAATKVLSNSSTGFFAKTGKFVGGAVHGAGRLLTTMGKIGSSAVSIGTGITFWISIINGALVALTSVLGVQEEYDALVQKGAKTLQAIFTPTKWASTHKVIGDIAATNLASLEKYDKELRNLESFKFKKKVLGVEIELEKTKEDLVKDVSKALTTASEGVTFGQAFWDTALDFKDISWGEFALKAAGITIGGLIGGPIGAAVGYAVASGIQASINSGEVVKTLDDATKSVITNRKGAEVFTGEGASTTETALAVLEEEIGATKNLSLEARKYYETAQDIIIATKGNLTLLTEMEKLAESVGASVGDLQKAFETSVDVTNNLLLSTTTLDIPVTITLVDVDSTIQQVSAITDKMAENARNSSEIVAGVGAASIAQFTAQLEDAQQNLEKLQDKSAPTGVFADRISGRRADKIEQLEAEIKSIEGQRDLKKQSVDSFIDSQSAVTVETQKLGNSLIATAENSNNATVSMVQFTNTLNDANIAATNGILTLEKLSQIDNVLSTSLQSTNLSLSAAEQAYNDTTSSIAALTTSKDQLTDIQKEELQRLIDLQAEQRKVLDSQEDARKKIIEQKTAFDSSTQSIRETLKEIDRLDKAYSKFAKAPVSTAGLFDSSGLVITDAAESQAAIYDDILSTASRTSDAYAKQQKQIANIGHLTALTKEQQQLFGLATTDNIDELIKAEGITGSTAALLKIMVTQTSKQAYEAQLGSKALTILDNMIIDAVKQTDKLVEAQEKYNNNLSKSLAISRLQHAITMAKLNADIAQQKIANEIANDNYALDAARAQLAASEKALENSRKQYAQEQALAKLAAQRASDAVTIANLQTDIFSDALLGSSELDVKQKSSDIQRQLAKGSAPDLSVLVDLEIAAFDLQAAKRLDLIDRERDAALTAIDERNRQLLDEKAQLTLEIASTRAINSEKFDILKKEEAIALKQIDDKIRANTADRNNIELQNNLNNLKIRQERDNNIAQLDLISKQAEAFNPFLTGVDTLDEVVSSFLDRLQGTDNTSLISEGSRARLEQAQQAASTLNAELETSRGLINAQAREQMGQLREATTAQLALNDEKAKGLADERTAILENFKERRRALALENASAISVIRDRIALIDKEIEASEDATTKANLEHAKKLQQEIFGILTQAVDKREQALDAIDSLLVSEAKYTTELSQQALILDKQNGINEQRAQNALAAATEDNRIAALERQLALDTQLLDNEKARLDLVLQQADYLSGMLDNRKDLDASFTDAFKNSELELRVVPYIDDFISELQNLNVDSKITTDILQSADALEEAFRTGKGYQEATIAFQQAAMQGIFEQQNANFELQEQIALDNLKKEKTAADAAMSLLDAEFELEKQKLENDKTALEARRALVEAERQNAILLAKVANGMIEVINAETRQYNKQNPDSYAPLLSTIGMQDIPDISANTELALGNIDKQISGAQTVYELTRQELQLKADGIQAQIDEFAEASEARKQALTIAQQAELAALQNQHNEVMTQIADVSDAEQKRFDKIKEAMLALIDGIVDPIHSALSSLNDLVFYGEGNFRDILSTMFKDIQKNLFETTIAKPLTDKLKESVGLSLFGISATGIENAEVRSDGALKVYMAEDLLGGLTGENGVLSKEAKSLFGKEGTLVDLFSGIFGKDGVFVNLLGNVFGKDGLFSNLLSGLFGGAGGSGLLGGIFSFVGGLFGLPVGLASGGSVQQFAAGGGVQKLASGGASLRDRVPAMLEPGEFVIRKQAAQKVGRPALQQINATGNTGTMQAPVINFNNEGSPKEMQSSKPKFDGDKWVIDIVTRDLANNGPIRRSLRGK